MQREGFVGAAPLRQPELFMICRPKAGGTGGFGGRRDARAWGGERPAPPRGKTSRCDDVDDDDGDDAWGPISVYDWPLGRPLYYYYYYFNYYLYYFYYYYYYYYYYYHFLILPIGN